MNTKKLALLLATMMIFTACKAGESSSQAESKSTTTTQATTSEPTSSTVSNTTSTQAPVSNEIGADEFKDAEYLNLLKQLSDKVNVEVAELTAETVGAKGGDGIYNYIGKYSWLFNEIPYYVHGDIDTDDVNQWSLDFYAKGTGDKISENPNSYSFFKEFNVTWDDIKDDIKEVNDYYIKSNSPKDNYYSEDEWKLILNGTEEEIAEYFAYDKAVAVDDKVYSAQWLYEHDLSDYVEAGITPAQVDSKMKIYEEEFVGDFVKGMQKKNDAYKKLSKDVLESHKRGEKDFDIEKWKAENLE